MTTRKQQPPSSPRGRGSSFNPANRFERIHRIEEGEPDGSSGPRTRFYRDASKSIISFNDSPDVPFDASINVYRGCEHGCSYCYARPTHEYLGFSAGLDFETRILVKEDAPTLLRRELSSSRWQPRVLGMSGVTDAYQPIEKKLELTRACLEVLREARNPVGIITKNALVLRDLDHLRALAAHDAAAVYISMTSLSPGLAGKLEPRASSPARRLEAIEKLAAAGVPVGVLVAPVIPGLNEVEIPAILEAASRAGAHHAGHVMLRLPRTVAPVFESWLEEHFPDRKKRVLNRVREMRGGAMNRSRFGERMSGTGVYARQVADLFGLQCQLRKLSSRGPELSTRAFRRPGDGQDFLDLLFGESPDT